MFKLIMLFVLLMTVLLSGCVPTTLTGSGKVVTLEEAFTGFDKVEVSNAFKVDITQSGTFSIVVRVDSSFEQRLEVVKEGDTLKIGLKAEGGDGKIQAGTREVEITMPELAGLDLSGASDATISGFKSTNNLTVDLSGASSLGGDIESGDASFILSGSSDTNLTGSGGNLTLDASGSSDVDLSEYPVADANLNVGGASMAIVNPSDVLNVEASGASDVYYLGSPSLGSIEASGASTVEPK